MPVKITYIISNISKSLAFEWITLGLDRQKFHLSFILLNPENSELEMFLSRNGFPVKRIHYRGKKDIPLTILEIYRYLKKTKPEIIHTHLFDANIAGLIAARILNIKKRIYTRHHSSYHHVYHPGGVKWDKLCNALATDIVSISNTVTEILTKYEKVPVAKIHTIYHGFDLDLFRNGNTEVITNLKKKYNPENKYPVIGVISRFTEWKGVHYIIPAFRDYLQIEPNALLLLFNAYGDFEDTINTLLQDLPSSSFKKISFENEITSLYHVFDLFIHVPIDFHSEAFGQTYIECLASGVPLIATKSGIGNEIMEDGKNCITAIHKNSTSIYDAIVKLQENPQLKQNLINNGLLTVKDKFALTGMLSNLTTLYLQ